MNATQQDTATHRHEHSCETLMYQGYETFLSCLYSAVSISTWWQVHELNCQTLYIHIYLHTMPYDGVRLTTHPLQRAGNRNKNMRLFNWPFGLGVGQKPYMGLPLMSASSQAKLPSTRFLPNTEWNKHSNYHVPITVHSTLISLKFACPHP